MPEDGGSQRTPKKGRSFPGNREKTAPTEQNGGEAGLLKKQGRPAPWRIISSAFTRGGKSGDEGGGRGVNARD